MFVTCVNTNNVIRTISFKIDTEIRFLYFTNITDIITTTITSFK